MAEIIQNMYSSVDAAAQQFAFIRNFAAPLDINQVMHSIKDLETYIDNATNAYPGQIIAIDDNLSDNPKKFVENRDEIGLYYIYYDKELNKLNYQKIAFLNSIGPDLERVIKLLNKINNLNDNCPWQVMSDNDNKPNIYNYDAKLYTDIIDQYNEAGIYLTVTINPKTK